MPKKVEKVAAFRASHLAQVFVLSKNIEAIQESSHDSMIFFAANREMAQVQGDAYLLSLRYFGHNDAYLPADGSRFHYFLNKDQVLFIETKNKAATVHMKSGNSYFVKAETNVIVRNLIARDFDAQDEEPAPTRRLKDAVPDLEEL